MPGQTQNKIRLQKLKDLFEKTAPLEGAVIELGCFQGFTTKILRKLINEHCPGKELHVFDSFQGLEGPFAGKDKNLRTTQFGEWACSRGQFLKLWPTDLELPVIHEGFFRHTYQELPDTISFALIDFDLYEATKLALEEIYPRLSKGGVIIIDDYDHGVYGLSMQNAIKDAGFSDIVKFDGDGVPRHGGDACQNAHIVKTNTSKLFV